MKRILLTGLAFLLLCSFAVNAAEFKNKKIAVAASGKTSKTSVSNKAAKCPYYLIFDSKGKMTAVIDNPYRDASRRAGSSAANFLAQRDVTIIIAKRFGLKMINTLKINGITHFEFEGRVDDAVKKVLK